jgi:hypothetical protein
MFYFNIPHTAPLNPHPSNLHPFKPTTPNPIPHTSHFILQLISLFWHSGWFVLSNNPETYAGGSDPIGMASLARQVKVMNHTNWDTLVLQVGGWARVLLTP